MKSVYFKVLFLFLAVAGSDKPLQAQGIYQFWGSTSTGGADDRGVLFSTKYDGSGFTLRHDFTTEHPGRAGLFQAPVAYNGKLYTLIEQYTVYFHSYCIITAYDIASGTYEQVADLALIDGRVAGGRLILHNNKLYGVTTKGGEHNEGLLFEYDPLTGTLLKKHDFAYATGSKPSSGLTAYNGQLYGTTPEGGDFDKGVLYQYDPSSGNFSIEKHFPDTYGYQNSGLTVYDGKLWGVNNNGIFAYVPGTDVLNTYAPVANIGLNSVYGHLTVLNGKLYGVANDGGSSGVGGIFEFNPATTALQLKYSFNEFSAQRRCELTVYAGKLYSSSYFSSDDTYGVLFSYDPILNVYENKIQFDATNSRGSGSLCLLGDLLYGFTWQGGAYNEGSLFAYEPATNLFEVKVNLGGNNLFHPVGRMISYNNKLYGLASTDVLTLQSGIFEYDPLLQTCVLKRSLSELEGITGSNQEGMIFYNNKFYGITTYGGTYGEGVLFSYNPATNTYAKIHDFDPATGSNPHAQLQLYAGRLYGTTNSGSTHDLGNIFEYNLLTGTYTQKVIFSETFGKRHYEGMTLVGNKFYGISLEGGTYGTGTLYEYDPVVNGFSVKINFQHNVTGSLPGTKLALYNDRLYGLTNAGGLNNNGVLFAYSPLSNSFEVKYHLDEATGSRAWAGLVVNNGYLYGTTPHGGADPVADGQGGGILFAYNPLNNVLTKKHDFAVRAGFKPAAQLLRLPAFVAPGMPGTCHQAGAIESTGINAYEWLPLTDAQGNAIAEINPNGNILGQIDVDFYVHDGPVRSDASGTLYLDRNITIQTEFAPLTPVSVRLYIKQEEADQLIAQPDAGIGSVADLKLFKNEDPCQPSVAEPALPMSAGTVISNWSNGYVFSFDTDSLSSFYFAGTGATVLPIDVIELSGTAATGYNLLQWTSHVAEEQAVLQLEKSGDGKTFKQIYEIPAIPESSSSYSFEDHEVLPGATYYRLLLKSENKNRYSNIVLLHPSGANSNSIQVYPNPAGNEPATLAITATETEAIWYKLYDVTGRLVREQAVRLQQGNNLVPLDLADLGSGVYYLNCSGGSKQYGTIKVVKK